MRNAGIFTCEFFEATPALALRLATNTYDMQVTIADQLSTRDRDKGLDVTYPWW